MISADVLLMDVVDSSASADRAGLQGRLSELCDELSQRHREHLIGRFEITRGDEVAAVFDTPSPLFEVIEFAEEHLAPDRLRYVVCRGELTAGLGSGRSTVLDGPAFWRAGDAIEELKKTDLPILVERPDERLAALVTSLFSFRILHLRGLTEMQRQIVRLYRELHNQTRVAEAIQRTQQQVQKTLAACHWDLIEDSELSLRQVLATWDDPDRNDSKESPRP